ncbi:MAG: trans-2-enoyl-CoA reductase family protein [Gemmatimonadetes bacterium]|nr:trans-2-enoyl-CoA reductase family protein [Gemmatimonadota bacterium]MYG14878.1 trans-2-enoyl-CoA reductase family protein [Gemmatimonadota bacterium]
MATAVVEPRIRGFICTTAHPAGCASNVNAQIQVAQSARSVQAGQVGQKNGAGPLRVLVIGASTGYGLAARIAAGAMYEAGTVGVFFERESSGTRCGTPGFYNTAAYHRYATESGLVSANVNGDAYSHEIKQKTVELVASRLGQVDLVVYSLASPKRTDPDTGETYQSVLSPIGETYVGKTVDLNREVINEVTVEPATEEGIRGTVGVMGGDDLNLWCEALLDAGLLADGARIVPFSYIGPALTWPIYRSGTIGRAKEHLEQTTKAIDGRLRSSVGGRAMVSVNKAVITQASAAIPVVPLYISLLYRIMRERGLHEDPIHQMVRLFNDHIGPGRTPALDGEDRIRLDDLELVGPVQREIDSVWPTITTDNFRVLTDYDAYKRGFRQLFGFEVDGVAYDEPVELEAEI